MKLSRIGSTGIALATAALLAAGAGVVAFAHSMSPDEFASQPQAASSPRENAPQDLPEAGPSAATETPTVEPTEAPEPEAAEAPEPEPTEKPEVDSENQSGEHD